jgi:hypothetical protein
MRILLYPSFGSTVKQWNKMKNIYKDIFGKNTNIDVIEYKINDAISFNKWKEIREKKKLIELSNEYDCIHFISGGCLIGFNQLNFQKEINCDKFIFDSGPFFPCPDLTSNYIYNHVNWMPLNTVKPISKLIKSYWINVENMDYEYELKKYNNWLNNNKKSLCLVNKNDNLLDFNRINNFLIESDSNVVFFDSKHARLMNEKEKYYENIKSYLN